VGFLQAFGVMPLIETYWVPFVWVVAQGVSSSIPFCFRSSHTA
jgi:hypothetical protein